MINNTGDNTSFRPIRNGDIGAYEMLFRRYYPSLCVVARQLVMNEQAAEDAVQEVFIRLWEKKGEYEEILDVEAFLYVAVKNRCLDLLKREKKTVDYSTPEIVNQTHGFRDLVIEEETYRIIMEAVNTLPAQSSRIIKMYLDGKKNQEIADELGVSVNTVKSLKYSSLDTLRTVLKDYVYILLILLVEKY